MMKCTYVLVSLLILCNILSAQEIKDTTYWKKKGDFTLSFNQVSFSNWSGGGKNSVSGVAFFNCAYNYLKERKSWDNSLNLGYGLLKESKSNLTKSEDRMEFSSKAGYRMTESGKLFLSGLFAFRSQFANGYYYPDSENKIKISGPFAPAYINLALGVDIKARSWSSFFFSPLSSKFTIVADDVLSAAGAFGVEKGKKFRAELGATIKSELKIPIVKNVEWTSALLLFSNYLKNPQNIDVNWTSRINLTINKFMSANLFNNLIYDDDVFVAVDRNGDGRIDGMGRRVQQKQLFGAGLSFKF